MIRLKVALKFVSLALVTGLAGLPSLLVWLVTLGAQGPASRVGSRCCWVWSRAALRIIGIEPLVRGRPKDKVFLVAANHLSYLDIWVLGSLYPCGFVAKQEIASWPLFGGIARVGGTLFVKRENPRDLVRTARVMTERFEQGVSLTLFPEGKATDGESVLPFMPSLFESAANAGIPCYAASVGYETPASPAPPCETVCWWGGQPFVPHILRLLRLPKIEATVSFSDTPLRSTSRKELARRLHDEVQQRFVPIRRQPLENVS